MRLTTNQLLNLFGRTADGMIAIDALSRIVAWNRAAVDLFGYPSEEVMDKCCAEVLRWRDRNLQLVCGPECTIRIQAAKGLIADTQNVIARAKSGRSILLNVSTLVLPREHHRDCRLVHFVREVNPPSVESGRERAGELELIRKLTPREREVVDLLTMALGTVEMAQRLGVSPTTVRNHVQRILVKLEVHNRAEAIALAVRIESQRKARSDA